MKIESHLPSKHGEKSAKRKGGAAWIRPRNRECRRFVVLYHCMIKPTYGKNTFFIERLACLVAGVLFHLN